MSTSFGRYLAERELGKGGMGVVFRGRDPVLDRIVAIKVLHIAHETPASNSEQFRERFFREARAAAGLTHPNVVTVYDMGIAEDQNPFLVMELVEGVSLQTELERSKRLAPDRVVTIGSQLAAALTCAHAAGLVHRDVKPANVLLAVDGTAKLMDFGLAKVAESTLTVAGQFLGSPLFSSPEQLRGTAVQAASDVFSLGVTLWVLLTGKHPFRRAGMQETIRAIVFEEALAPSSVVADLDPAWDVVLGKALAKDPADRFASASEFMAALKNIGSADTAAPQSSAGEQPPTAAVVPPPPQALELVVEQGPDKGLRIALGSRIEVGRGRGDFPLTDGAVSSSHCLFELTGDAVIVKDIGSTNGSFIDEHRLATPTRVPVGARIRLGMNTVVRLQAVDAREAPVTASTLLDGGGSVSAAGRVRAAETAFVLLVDAGPRKGARIPLAASIVLSRDEGPGCLDDAKVSRKHASIEVRPGQRVYLRDLASTNGTWLDEQRIREVELRVGDRFRVGDTTLHLDRAV